jgi:hypothetical protein
MTEKKITSFAQLDGLTDSLVKDIIELTDEEILDEAIEQYTNPESEVDRLKSLINNALLQSAKTKLINAKNSAHAYKQAAKENNVVHLSIAEKHTIIKNFTTRDPELQQKLTLAARKGEGIQTENDIEGMFEDMIELGLIDTEGRSK